MSSRPACELTEGQAALRRFVILGVALVALLLASVAALLVAGSRAVDGLQVRDERARVTIALDKSLRSLVNDTTTATVWDQAYEQFRPGGSLEWADEEIGSYFANNRGHDVSVAVDERGTPFYAWVGLDRADPTRQARFLADVAPLVRKARALEVARGATPPLLEPTDPNLAETASGVIVSEGVHYLVAVSTVTPEHAFAPRRPGPGVLLVSAQRMDRQLMAELSQIQISKPRIERSPTDSRAAVPLRDANGRAVGWLTWTPQQPSLRVLMNAGPAVVLSLLAVSGLMAALAWQLLRAARRLGAHERALTAAMHGLEAAPGLAQPPLSDAEPTRPRMRVLAAEDNATNRLLLGAMLEPLGIDLKVVTDGRAAVDAFAAERFDLVLMDAQMPGMDGVVATRAIRALEVERGMAPTPILAVSADVMRDQVDGYLAAGMSGFVEKPIEQGALIAAIEAAVRADAPGVIRDAAA